ncbi:MAG: hypothetical protein QXJ97_05380 [Desulfurococcaceae archaeon]
MSIIAQIQVGRYYGATILMEVRKLLELDENDVVESMLRKAQGEHDS